MTHTSFARTAFLFAAILIPSVALTSQQTSSSQRFPQFENGDVNVWKTVVMPNAPMMIHTHDHPRVIVALTSGKMKIAYQDGASETHEWEAGKAYWLSGEEGKRPHADVNIGDKPVEVMVVELKTAK